MGNKAIQVLLGLLLGASLLAVSVSAGHLAPRLYDHADDEQAWIDARMDAADAEIVRKKSIARAPGEALVVSLDLVAHELVLETIPLDSLVLPVQGHEDDPNCLSTQRRAWVQVDQPLNQNTPGDLGEIGVPGVTGSCRSWGGMHDGAQSLTFVLAERFGGRLDGVDWPTQSFIVVECEDSGFTSGPLSQDEGPASSCEYRQGGGLPPGWTEWDSLLTLSGQTAAGSGYGFGYAVFE